MAYGQRCRNCLFQESAHYEGPIDESDPDLPNLDDCMNSQSGFNPEDPIGEAMDYLTEVGANRIMNSEVVNDRGDTVATTLPLPGEGRIIHFIKTHRKRMKKAVRKTMDIGLIRSLDYHLAC